MLVRAMTASIGMCPIAQAGGSSAPDQNPGDDAPPGAPGTGENVCPVCGGSGEIEGASCRECAGTGKVNVGIGGG
jgi:hypothetical protein